MAVANLLVRFYDMLMGESMFLRADVNEELKQLGFRMGVIYSSLANIAMRAGRKLWKITPMVHIFVHLCEWQAQEYGNPRYYWCYPDEDLVGLSIDIAETCHPKTLAVNCIFKWLHLHFGQQ